MRAHDPGVLELGPERLASAGGALPATLADAVADVLFRLGVRHAYGVSGGAMATLWHALSRSPIALRHFRHESGAAFAATEAHFASDRPVAVFTTTGPGVTNALTGLLAAHGDGAKILLLSAATTAAQRGRWAIQETSGRTMPGDLYAPGALFHDAVLLESPEELPAIARRWAHGFSRPGGFIAHLAIPTGLQNAAWRGALPDDLRGDEVPMPDEETLAHAARLLSEPFAIWVGFGARHAAPLVRRLAERTGVAVMCSPRAKGIFPEDHPQFIGVTGIGGHASVIRYGSEVRPRRVLVLGTRLGEGTSFWSPALAPEGGFVHVDADADVPGTAYPNVPTFAVRADIGAFLGALLDRLPERRSDSVLFPTPERPSIEAAPESGAVRPEALMEVIQEIVVDRQDGLVLAESGNSFTWTTHCLRFREPGRYRVSTRVGSMGHAAAGVLGAADARGGKAVAVVGDGALLMTNEINTAVRFGLPAVWIVLNDARYNMCAQGMATLGLTADASIPEVDFALLARALGADGLRVEREGDLVAALQRAMAAEGPFVVDVRIDPSRPAPSGGRNAGLRAQIDAAAPRPAISFPVTH